MVDEAAARTPGKRSLAMAAFARALRSIPTIISDNAGANFVHERCDLDPLHAVPHRNSHAPATSKHRYQMHHSEAVTTGLDSAELVSQLRAAHASDDTNRSGVDVIEGRMGDMQELGIFEAFKVSLKKDLVVRALALVTQHPLL